MKKLIAIAIVLVTVFALAIPAMCLSITGGWLGSKMALMRGAKFIRYVMLGVLALLVVTLIMEVV